APYCRQGGHIVKPARWLLLVTVIGAVAASSCGSPIPTAQDSGVDAGIALAVGGRGDKGINDLASGGLDRAKQRLGVDISLLTLNQRGEQRSEGLARFARAGLRPIIAVGDDYTTHVADVARRYTDTTFAIVDSAQPRGDNITNLTFAEEQGSYLMGVAAARKSTTARVGFVGGSNDARTRRYQAGFVAGVKSILPGAVIDVRFVATAVTQPSEASPLGRSSPTAARAIAEQLLQGGADVLYHAAGDSGSGVFDAVVSARARGDRSVWAIGSDTDQALVATAPQKEIILTSMIKRSDNAVYQFVDDYIDGGTKPGVRRFTLADEGMSIATSGRFLAKYKLLDELQRVQADIAQGRVVVPSTV
ncbi:MAG: BMP family lipoprotein, partial [Mycobacteriales bacterium]